MPTETEFEKVVDVIYSFGFAYKDAVDATREFYGVNGLSNDTLKNIYEWFLEYEGSDGMPYGIAKARTGDPYEWITERIQKISTK